MRFWGSNRKSWQWMSEERQHKMCTILSHSTLSKSLSIEPLSILKSVVMIHTWKAEMTEGKFEKESNVSPLLFSLRVRERQGRKNEREGGRQAGAEGSCSSHTNCPWSYFPCFFLLFLPCKMVLWSLRTLQRRPKNQMAPRNIVGITRGRWCVFQAILLFKKAAIFLFIWCLI